jgi:hypothetical protein
MATCVKSGVDGSIEKGGGEFDNLALLLKRREIGQSVVTDQLLHERTRWSLQRDDCNHEVSLMRDWISLMWSEIEDPMAPAGISQKIKKNISSEPCALKIIVCRELFLGSSNILTGL